jgi:tetratricopeptide (TPR) repeat protein
VEKSSPDDPDVTDPTLRSDPLEVTATAHYPASRSEEATSREVGEATVAGDPNGATTVVSPDVDGPTDSGAVTMASSHRPAPGRRSIPTVPGYVILGELGRGAMGVVYHARQLRLNRPCALKMILAGAHADPESTVRFLAEAEAVARLQHPNVVQIHHIGEADGLPFFELEYVAGGSLDQALDGTPRPPREAAKLVEALALAVAEAHRQGIVHRDLKPANVLMAADGTPKITDFGLAKSLEAESGLTRTESILGSPSYMAPEQAEGHAREAGAAADVYALGAILYELVTGRPPFKGATVLQTLEQVKSVEPVPPSRLVPGLPHDVETIGLRCLQKDPTKRYASAGALAEDLRRFQAGEPILARRTGPGERAWRWCRRNPAVAALLMLVGLLLTGGVVGSAFAVVHFRQMAQAESLARKEAVQLTVAERQARGAADRKAAEAKAVVDFLVNDMLAAANPENSQGGAVTVENVLAQADKAIAGRFADQPLVEASIRHTIGETYHELGQWPKAEPHVARARDLRGKNLGPEDPATLQSALLLARILHRQGRYDQARPIAQKVYEARRRRLGEEHPETAEALAWIAHTINNNPARLEEARAMFTRALAAMRREWGPGDPRVIEAMGGLAWTLGAQGRIDESLAVSDELIDLARRKRGPDDVQVERHLAFKSDVLTQFGRYEQACAVMEEALRISRKVRDPSYGWAYRLISVLVERRQLQAANLAAQRGPKAGLAALARALPYCDLGVARAEAWLAREPQNPAARQRLVEQIRKRSEILAGLGRDSEAKGERGRAMGLLIDDETLFTRLEGLRADAAPQQLDLAASELARLLERIPDRPGISDQRAGADIEIVSREALFSRVVALRPKDTQLWVARGRYLAWLGRWDEAAAAYRRALRTPRPFHDEFLEGASTLLLCGDVAGYRRWVRDLEDALRPRGELDGFRAHLMARMRALSPESPDDLARLVGWAESSVQRQPHFTTLHALGLAYLRAGRLDEAVRQFQRSIASHRTWNAIGLNYYGLALAHHRLGHTDEARRWLEKAEAWFTQLAEVSTVEATSFPPDYHVVDWLEAQVLRREAESLILDVGFPDDPFVRS